MKFTPEQMYAIERRSGDLLLDAAAGSGKTSVLVERYARAVLEDGVDVGQILTITFTEKAAAELRERIRARLRALGADEAARATEGAWISTIHAFCARVLRANALAAGLDPGFAVLEPTEAAEMSSAAFDAALGSVAKTAAGAELIATHGVGPVRSAILAVHGELRSRGQRHPALPPVAPVDAGDLAAALQRAREAARVAGAELGAVPGPGVRVLQSLEALDRAAQVLAADEVWPGDLGVVALPARNGASALSSEACDVYREALDALRSVAARGFAVQARAALDALLRAYAERYAVLKARRSAVDFEDLELLARDLLIRPEIGRRLRERFAHVMVDELQDTNRVQLELIDLVASGSLFMVGDAQQSIYGFRHAEVELFEARGRELEASGARASLQTNFRSRPEILAAINAGFSVALGERFRPLVPGREPAEDPAVGSDPRVELLVVDKGADWEDDGLAAPWRVAEARALARRVLQLIAGAECSAGDVVVLTRATTDLAAYERALEDAGVPTYVIGGRGYWSHPQVVEMVAYLRALANPLDQEPWYATLVSPLCGLSLDGLVLVAAGAREELGEVDRERLERFEAWFTAERVVAARLGVEELLDRVIERTGYDRVVLGLPGGRRRLANVRKLMRLGREWETRAGSDLHGFVGLCLRRSGDGRESEAPVESEGLDAVRLMTIHRAKGLEFPVVCVADLGRGPMFRPELIRIGADGHRLGLRLGRPGTGERIPALDYDALGVEQQVRAEAEERRLFYVAVTRARERLILSGAANWGRSNRSTPIGWIAPAFVADLEPRAESSFVTDLGVRYTFIQDVLENKSDPYGQKRPPSAASDVMAVLPVSPEDPHASPPQPVSSLSYSSLADYHRCGYRFYVERVLGLPPTEAPPGEAPPGEAPTAPPGLGASERGTLVHAALQNLDFRRPVVAPGTPAEIAALLEAFIASPTRERLAGAREVRREQRFAFPLGDVLITGTFDVLAGEGPGRLLVVDYKTGRFASYAMQRLIYALAALRTGVAEVEVVHLFLEAREHDTSESFRREELARLEGELAALTAGVVAGEFAVTPEPHRGVCAGCPAAGGLCSWPLEVAMRPQVDRLF